MQAQHGHNDNHHNHLMMAKIKTRSCKAAFSAANLSVRIEALRNFVVQTGIARPVASGSPLGSLALDLQASGFSKTRLRPTDRSKVRLTLKLAHRPPETSRSPFVDLLRTMLVAGLAGPPTGRSCGEFRCATGNVSRPLWLANRWADGAATLRLGAP